MRFLSKGLLLVLLMSLLSWWPGVTPAQAQIDITEKIRKFTSHITINQDTSLSITEDLEFYTPVPRHGIYRYIPYRYNRGGFSYTAELRNFQVTDEVGEPINYEASRESGNIKLKIGDADETFTGSKQYRISYKVFNALQVFDDHVELFWDITGEGWQVPVGIVKATIESPYAPLTKADCYSGSVGNNDRACRFDHNQQAMTITYDAGVDYGDNVSVVLALDKTNSLQFPSAWERWWQTNALNLWLLPLCLPLFLIAGWWWKHGRDWLFVRFNVFDHGDRPKSQQLPWFQWHTPMVYEPLKLSPSLAGAMLDEKIDQADLVAEILELARLKYLKIEQIKKKSFFGDVDYQFTLLKDIPETLPTYQKTLLNGLFSHGATKTVKLSELKGKFYTTVDKFKQHVFDELTTQELFLSHPMHTRNTAMGVSIGLSVVAITAASLLTESVFLGSPVPIFVAIAQAVISLWWSRHLPAKTAAGYNYMMQAKGLKQTIQHGAWREKIKEKHLFIEEVLPFAVALGVVNQLARDMDKLNLKPPEYVGGRALDAHHFRSFTNSFTSQAGSSLSYNPSSSSMSGGSGFSGGSSGGGGGGGGGGSW